MKAYVDPDLCISCGLCPSICPDVFSMDDETDKAVAIEGEIASEVQDAAVEARDSCPVSAIDINE